MDETKRAWDEVGDGFAKLGRAISERHRHLGEERATQPPTGAEGRMAEAVRRATDELDRAFAALGDTFRNDDAREQARDTGRKLSDALKVTFAAIGDEVRGAVGGRSSTGTGEPPAAAPPPPPSPAPPPPPTEPPGPETSA